MISAGRPAAVNSMTELSGSSKCLQIVSGLHGANINADILKSPRRTLAIPFETSQVEPILKNCYAAENQAFLEMSDQRYPCSLVLEWLNTCIFRDIYSNFHTLGSRKTDGEIAAQRRGGIEKDPSFLVYDPQGAQLAAQLPEH